MQILKTVGSFIFTSFFVQVMYSQHLRFRVSPIKDFLFNNTQFLKTDSGLIISYYYREACKNYAVKNQFISDHIVVTKFEKVPLTTEYPVRPKLITIHGNVSYDYFYRSKVDTPFLQQNLQQHTERVWLDVLIKEKYPFKFGFTATQSNSPFLRDLFNINLNFDKYGFNKNIKRDLLDRLAIAKFQNPDLKRIDADLKDKLKRYQDLKSRIDGPDALQAIIEEKEKMFYNKQKKDNKIFAIASQVIPVFRKIKLNNGQFSTLKSDSIVVVEKEISSSQIDSTITRILKNKKDSLNDLALLIAKLKHQSDSLKNYITQNVTKIKQSIYQATNPKDLEKIAKENGISEPKKERFQNFISNIKTFGIGRNLVDYTELTAQNVMLTGVNIEYNPSYYAAFAAGKIDYGFRDFLGRGVRQKNQSLILGRMGWGYRDRSSVIFTFFNGRKDNYAGLLASDSNYTARLFGYSVETTIKKNENTFLSVEVAKSTKSNDVSPQGLVNKTDNLFNFSDKTNMGLNVKMQTALPKTDLRLSGFFRKTGQAFQSFSLVTYNTNQQAWQVRADQSLLKRKVILTAMLRQNDFANPLATQTFKTTTVFKSLQLNVRVPRWPTVNAGYFPGSQFYVIDNNTVRENAYYILNGSVIHAYKVKDISMSSALIYNRYFNKATDSGFVLYKGINYILSQSLLVKKLRLEGNYSYNAQSELNYFTLDANGDYSLKKVFRIGGGFKYNHVERGQSYWGESIRLSVDSKNLGGLQLHYEKSYLPTIQQILYPVEIGRVSWYKIF